MSHTPVNVARLLLVASCLVCQAGCTSALTTTYLRDALWDVAEHASEAATDVADATAGDDAEPAPAAAASAGVDDDISADRADAERRQAAIEEAVERLSRIGTLDSAAQATLVETLQATQQEDWPVVIEAFAATLAETKTPPAAAPHVVAKAASEPAAPPEPAPAAEVAVAAAPEPPAAPATDPPAPAAPVPAPVPAPAAAPFVVKNACFASRVEAWGVVERFAEDRFRPGQEVIVYFELEGLSSGGSPAGFTTCIDTVLRLEAEDGRELHAWRFEPIAETCAAARRDYFARYVVRLPDEVAAGGCRLELVVTDTLAGKTADATLPCRVE